MPCDYQPFLLREGISNWWDQDCLASSKPRASKAAPLGQSVVLEAKYFVHIDPTSQNKEMEIPIGFYV
ncbi:hypothetical protein CEXT_76781 [Caerostris extrusa]|uniref:Uncharacterized protein n=1 Tax=Caerostris extrusa TaxID=172846 RepID=A0AAV4V9S0_CAEEX|nr:hypothetical protein CEXT_76781 [Caerostris extrusa]